MIVLNFFIWLIAIISILIFFRFFLLPYIQRKIIFWFMSMKIKKMAKKHSGKEAELLNEIAKGLSEINKTEKL